MTLPAIPNSYKCKDEIDGFEIRTDSDFEKWL